MKTRGIPSRLLVVGGALVIAGVAGSIIGGFGATSPQALDAAWRPPTQTVQPITTPLSAPPTTPTRTPQPTPAPAASAAPSIAPSPAPTAEAGAPVEAPQPEPAPSEAPFIEYTVQRGDILIALAARFNTTAPAIIALNPQINPDSLVVGAVLRIPRTGN